MNTATVQPANVYLDADRHIARWRPLVQWLLAVPHLMVTSALSTLRGILTLISLVTVLFTKRIHAGPQNDAPSLLTRRRDCRHPQWRYPQEGPVMNDPHSEVVLPPLVTVIGSAHSARDASPVGSVSAPPAAPPGLPMAKEQR